METQKITWLDSLEVLPLPANKIQNIMSTYLQAILNLLDKTRRQIEIHSSDYPFPSLLQIAKKLKEQDKTMSLVIDTDLLDYQIEQLIEASDDRFFFKR